MKKCLSIVHYNNKIHMSLSSFKTLRNMDGWYEDGNDDPLEGDKETIGVKGLDDKASHDEHKTISH